MVTKASEQSTAPEKINENNNYYGLLCYLQDKITKFCSNPNQETLDNLKKIVSDFTLKESQGAKDQDTELLKKGVYSQVGVLSLALAIEYILDNSKNQKAIATLNSVSKKFTLLGIEPPVDKPRTAVADARITAYGPVSE